MPLDTHSDSPALEVGLPSHFYYDPAHYEREFSAIWCRSWIPLCRVDDLARPRDFRVVELGDQSVLVVRNTKGELRAFHNTCRHRGSLLCTGEQGRFSAASIVCPYHAWTYSLDGELIGTPRQLRAEGFRREEYPLYNVAVDEWGGYVFANLLGAAAPAFGETLREVDDALRNWRIEELAAGHRSSTDLACNWKIFWENYLECFHCPGIHPELCRIVPIYASGLMSESQRPGAEPPPPGASEAPLAAGAVTWSLDGSSRLPRIPGLTPSQEAAGHTFGTHIPGFFLVAHVDYVRMVRVRPLGPERTRLDVEWLFPPAVLSNEDFDLEHAAALGTRVVEQDARACELNQRGVRSRAHQRGVLVPQEHEVFGFQRWVIASLG